MDVIEHRKKWAKGRWPIAYHHAMAIQQRLFEDIEDPHTKPVIRAALAKAYCNVEEMKRVLTMRPAPKAVDVSKERKREVEIATFSEPVTEQPNIKELAVGQPITQDQKP